MGNKIQNGTDPKIVQMCLDIIHPFLKGKGKFTKQEVSDINYSLIDAQGIYHTGSSSHGRSVPTLEMRNGFFLYCSIDFTKDKSNRKKKIFKGISLQFYDNHKLLFRAEWKNRLFLKDEQFAHSQPHWHFDTKGEIEIGENIAVSYADYQESSRYDFFSNTAHDDAKANELQRMHFFMSFENSTEDQACYTDLTNEKLLKQWLSTCLRMVEKELTFLRKKR